MPLTASNLLALSSMSLQRPLLVLWGLAPFTPIPLLGQITGRVLDAWDVPVPGARVILLPDTTGAETDSAGRFRLVSPRSSGCLRLNIRATAARTELRFPATGGRQLSLGDIPLRFSGIDEAPLLLILRCQAGPLTKEEAGWGVDTLREH